MITKAFSVYDSKALCFGVPFFMPTVGGAVRAFSDLCQDVQSLPSKHPGDFVLYQIGEFDDGKGVMLPMVPHLHLGIGLDFVQRPAVKVVEDMVKSPLATAAELEAANNGGQL